MNHRLNKYKYPGAKRLMLEALELKDKTEDYCAQPIDDNLFEWHFTVRGPPDTAFEGGFYHGRLSFPTEYPMKPPSIILLNPNGRFETNKKICLSISGFHPETWQPSWSVRTALLALIAFMPTKGNRAIGSLDYSDPERRKLAKNSRTWRCSVCGPIKDLLKQPDYPGNIDDKCQASSSRVQEENQSLSDSSQDVGSSSSEPSHSDGEISDNPTHSQESATSSDNSETNRIASIRLERRNQVGAEAKKTIDPESDTTLCDRVPEVQQNDGFDPIVAPNAEEQPSGNVERRSYPPMVFLSIFILLFLLIARRIVIILQA